MLLFMLSACVFTSDIQQNTQDDLSYLEETGGISLDTLSLKISGMDALPLPVLTQRDFVTFTFPDDIEFYIH